MVIPHIYAYFACHQTPCNLIGCFHSNDESKATNLIAEDGWSPPLLEMGHVRLVLFHDHDGRGKIPVFDTKQHYNQSRSKQVINQSINHVSRLYD